MRGEARFYGSLNDLLAPARRQLASEVTFADGETVKDLVESLGVPHTEVDLIVVDGRPVGFGHRLRPGDRVAVYPRFEAFELPAATRLSRDPAGRPRFVVDVHLGRLARHLRLLGFDSEFDPAWDDRELARRGSDDRRVLVTRDRGLLKRREVALGYLVRSTTPRLQLAELVARFGLGRSAAPFSRCLACNTPLRPIGKADVEARLPERVQRDRHEFTACPGCGRVFWRGSHYDRLSDLISEILAPPSGP